MLAAEILLVRGRLAALGAALEDRPLDLELLPELRGQQRTLLALLAAQAKLTPAAPVTPLTENPLQKLRREVEERKAARGGA